MILSEIKAAGIAFSIGVLIATPTGFYLANKFAKADRVDELVEVRKVDASKVVEAFKNESALQTEIHTTKRIIEKTRKEAKKHAIPTSTQVQNAEGNDVDCRAAVLGDDLVGMLNDARNNAIADPASGSDGEGTTTSDTEEGRDSQ